MDTVQAVPRMKAMRKQTRTVTDGPNHAPYFAHRSKVIRLFLLSFFTPNRLLARLEAENYDL
jgi:hypothetical protein